MCVRVCTYMCVSECVCVCVHIRVCCVCVHVRMQLHMHLCVIRYACQCIFLLHLIPDY